MRSLSKIASNLSNSVVLALIVGTALVIGSISIAWRPSSTSLIEWWGAALQNLSSGLIGAFVTFILIDLIIGGREKRDAEAQEESRRLFQRLRKRLRSPNNDITASAASELRRLGWLEDGSLEGAYLSYSNLENVDLTNADLEGARLTEAFLLGTNLRGVSLAGTTLKLSQLTLVHALQGATMPDGHLYDGRLSLQGDLSQARQKNINLDDPNQMAQFYGVSLNEYVGGQEWAKQVLAFMPQGSIVPSTTSWWER